MGVLIVFTAMPAHEFFAILMGLFFVPLFHGAYDFFLFINFIPRLWIGVIFSLIIGVFLSRKVIKKHENGSVFKVLLFF